MAQTTYELSDHDKGGFTKSVKAVLFYDLDGADPEPVVSSFQEGVKNAIRHLSFMAGNLQINESGKVTIVTSSESTMEVIVRRFTPPELPSFSDIAKDSFNPDTLDLAPFLPEEPTTNPVAIIQLNILDGGLAVGFRINHAAGDWVSIDTFLSLVCQSTKAHQEGNAPPAPLHAVDLNRAPFNAPPRNPDIAQEDHLAHLPLFHVIEKSKFLFNPPPPARTGIFRITESTVQKLKEETKPHLTGVEYITSYDIIAAIFWTALTRARVQTRPEKGDASSRFVHPIDVRSRDPENKSSPGYFGNAVIGSLAGPLSAKDLTKNDIPTLALAASHIRQSIQAISISSIAHMIALQASLSGSEMLIPNADFADMDLFMNTWYSGTRENYDLGGVAGPGPVAFRVSAGMMGACVGILPNLSRVGEGERVFEAYFQTEVGEFDAVLMDGGFLGVVEYVV
ncbi:transferase [Aspergillus crustosus]